MGPCDELATLPGVDLPFAAEMGSSTPPHDPKRDKAVKKMREVRTAVISSLISCLHTSSFGFLKNESNKAPPVYVAVVLLILSHLF